MGSRWSIYRLSLVRSTQVLAAYYVIANHVIGIQYCVGWSMLPTLPHDGAFLMHSPIPYWAPFFRRSPRRGELVVAASPRNPQEDVCKRVIGLAGDLIEVEPRRGSPGERHKWLGEEDSIYDEGEKGEGSKVWKWTDSEGRRMTAKRKGENQWIKVPKGYVWLAGDNMSNSTDSREYGPVPLAIIKGKVLARVWPRWEWVYNAIKPV